MGGAIACSPLSIQPSRPQLGTLSRRPPGVPARRGGCCDPQSSGRGGRPPTDAPFADPPQIQPESGSSCGLQPPGPERWGRGETVGLQQRTVGIFPGSLAPVQRRGGSGSAPGWRQKGRRHTRPLGFSPQVLGLRFRPAVGGRGAGGLPSLSTLVGGAVSVQGALHALQVFLLRDRQHRRQDLVLVPVRQTERGRRHLLHDGPALQGRVQGH